MDSSKQVSQVLVQSDEYPEPVGVRDVRALEGLRVRVVFTDGSERTLVLDPYLRGPLFEPIRHTRSPFALNSLAVHGPLTAALHRRSAFALLDR